jgi:hypothetical protein
LRDRLESANGNLDQICEELSDVERSLDPIASVFTPTPSPTLKCEAKNTALIIEIPKALPVKLIRHLELKGNKEIDVVAELRKGASTCFLLTLPIQVWIQVLRRCSSTPKRLRLQSAASRAITRNTRVVMYPFSTVDTTHSLHQPLFL